MNLPWRRFTDLAKRSPAVLRAADRLGRSRGRLRVFDPAAAPPRRTRPALDGWSARQLSVFCIGHATVLLRIGGRTVLTDPVFSDRIGVGIGLFTVGPRRLVPAALRISELPPIDLILITHAHFDHLDRPSLARLPKRTPIVTARHTADLIRDLGFRRVQELTVGQSISLDGLRLTAWPTNHWGARTFLDRHRGHNGYLIDAGPTRVLLAGDTADTPAYADVGGVDLSVFGIGAYDPYIQAHATPEQVWDMATSAGSRFVCPIHHRTFRLSHEPDHDPLRRLLAAAGHESRRIVARTPGSQWTL